VFLKLVLKRPTHSFFQDNFKQLFDASPSNASKFIEKLTGGVIGFGIL
tara:strand:- start:6279 stop:6422 length:144 start_codon:yes stop_codon:yes gene_type:complete